MINNFFNSPKNLRLIIAFLSALLVWQLFSSAQASTNSQLAFRIRRLETQVSQLRGDLSSLRIQSSPSINPVEGSVTEDIPPDPRSHLMSGDPMFDRLATLVIELKQDFQQLQQRVDEIESDTETSQN